MRVTVTLDPELVRVGNAAVQAGRAESLSEWINTAIATEIDAERRRKSARRALAALSKMHGKMSRKEIDERVAALRAAADRVRPSTRGRRAA